jgi:hypothetical protein
LSPPWKANQTPQAVSVASHVRPEGLPAGVIAKRLGVQPSSISPQLVHADLITHPCLSRLTSGEIILPAKRSSVDLIDATQ